MCNPGNGVEHVSGWLASPEIFAVMQYTCLKDKNGREIYDGDVLRTKRYGQQPRQIWEVVWDEEHWNAFCYKARNGIRNLLGQAMTVTRDMEVIGNIYENPELLERAA